MPHEDKKRAGLHAAIFFLTVVCFGVELVTPRGIEVWIFYVLPLILTAWSPHRRLPIIFAAIVSGLMLAGQFLSPESSISLKIALVNGTLFGNVAFWSIAGLIMNLRRVQRLELSAEERLRSIVETAVDGIIVIDDRGLIESANPAAIRLFGYELGEIIGHNVKMLMPEPYHSQHDAYIGNYITNGAKKIIGIGREVAGQRKDGSTFPMDLAVSEMWIEGRRKFTGIVHDVTDRKAIETSLRESEERMGMAIRIARLATWSWNVRENQISASPDLLAVFGFPNNGGMLPIEKYFDLIHPGDRDRVSRAISHTVETANEYFEQFRVLQPGGRIIWLELRGAAVPDETGAVKRLIGVTQDITARKQNEEDLRESAERLRMAVGIARMAAWSRSLPDNQMSASGDLQKLFGLPEDAAPITRESFIAAIHPEDRELVVQSTARAIEEGAEIFNQFRVIWPDGSIHWVESRGLAFRDETGTPVRLLGIGQDITERKQNEEALRESAERMRLAVGIARMGTWTWSFPENSITASPDLLGLFGAPEGAPDLTPELFASALHPEDRERVMQSVERSISEGREAVEQFRIFWPDGSIHWLESRWAVFQDPARTSLRLLGVSQEITERKAAEEEIRALNAELEQRVRDRTLALEAANKELETFSYSVSHDLRAPLRAIDGFSQALVEDYGERLDAEGRGHLGRVRSATQRMGMLIDDMLNLSRVARAEFLPQRVDLTALAEAACVELRTSDPKREVRITIAPGMEAEGDPRLLRIAFDNLIGNAWKFTGRTQVAEIEVGIQTGPGGEAFFVKDNGAGFDMNYAGKLFGAFQRLHDQQEFPGSGIGLAIVQRVISRHGGRVWAEGAPGKGAIFRFTLGRRGVES